MGLSELQKCKNFSQNELEQITRMNSLPQSELKKIAIKRIKNYKKMSKEGLLIALSKSEQSPTELYKSESNNAEIKEIKKNQCAKIIFQKKK